MHFFYTPWQVESAENSNTLIFIPRRNHDT